MENLKNELFPQIKELAKSKGISIKQLALKIGMTEGGFYKSFERNVLKLKNLLNICDVLNVKISVFFNPEKPELSDDEKRLIITLLIKNQISNETIKKIWDFIKP